MKQTGDLPLFADAKAEEIVGIAQRVIFHNDSNGFTVISIEPETRNGERVKADALVCVGHMFQPAAGKRLKFTGKFVNNPRFGRQFSADAVEEVAPATVDDMRQYLSSGLIKGVGPLLASRIIQKFGQDVIRILDEEPERLLAVKGVGKKNFERICQSWNEQRGMRELMLFLQPHGISPAYAVRIFKAYGAAALDTVKSNPYRLAMDVRGIGFVTADAIASQLGFAADHPLRIEAAALYALHKASEDGHVFLPKAALCQRVEELTGAAADQCDKAIARLEKDKRVVLEELDAQDEGDPVYLARFHHCESRTAYYLHRLLNTPKTARFVDPDKALARVLGQMDIELAPAQIEAVKAAATSKILVITGGPGTGKTTIINGIIKLFEQAKGQILLCAPTGRAARRMAEAAGREAKTVHRLLEYSPKDDCFLRNEDNPLACVLLVVDEASMLDAQLFYYLLKATPLGATVALVGDVNQLPSVGPGNVLGDIIDSGKVRVMRLTEIFRQAAASEIVCNAHLINKGQMPLMENSPERNSDFYFIQRNDPEDAAQLLVDLVKNHIPRRFGFDPVNDVQFLTPMHKGAVGAENMNSLLQKALNPNAPEVRKGERAFRLHDKVMQIRNNYDKDIFNGDIGRIIHIDVKCRQISVDFDGIVMPYSFEELDELAPAYAISIHKSQGSEYPAVVIPLMMQHYILLQRNLVYTGVTRGKKLVVLVGEKKAMQIAIRNNRTSRRYTLLARRLALGAD